MLGGPKRQAISYDVVGLDGISSVEDDGGGFLEGPCLGWTFWRLRTTNFVIYIKM